MFIAGSVAGPFATRVPQFQEPRGSPARPRAELDTPRHCAAPSCNKSIVVATVRVILVVVVLSWHSHGPPQQGTGRQYECLHHHLDVGTVITIARAGRCCCCCCCGCSSPRECGATRTLGIANVGHDTTRLPAVHPRHAFGPAQRGEIGGGQFVQDTVHQCCCG